MQPSDRLTRVSANMARLMTALAMFFPATVVLAFAGVKVFGFAIPEVMHGVRPERLTTLVLVLGCLAALVPALIHAGAALTLRRLFRLYARGIVFDASTTACFRRLSRWLFAAAIASLVVPTLHSLIFTMNNPPGEHMITITVGSTQIYLLASTAVFAVIAWVMAEAQRIADDNAGIV